MSIITLPVTEAKQRFTELVKGAGELYDRYLVTKNGKEAAVVMSAEEYGSLLETIDILSNKAEVRAIGVGREQAKAGKTVPLAAYRSARTSQGKKLEPQRRRVAKSR